MRRAVPFLAALALAAAVAWVAARDRGQTSAVVELSAAARAPRSDVALAPPVEASAARERVAELGAGAAAGRRPRVQVVEIQDAHGAPVAAPWAAFRGEEVLASGATAADGLARIEPSHSEAQLAVAPKNHPVQVFALEPVERQIVALDAGAAVAGVVRVDGLVPAEPVDLKLWCYGYDVLDHLSWPVWEALDDGTETHGTQTLYAVSGSGGSFRFEGLPADFSGDISWEGPFLDARVEDEEERSIDVPGPVENLVVLLEAVPIVVGRVIEPLSGQPVAEADISGAWFRGGRLVESYTHQSEDDGSFAIELGRGANSGLVLEVAHDGGAGSRRYEIELPPGVKVHEVGDLAVLPTRKVSFTVRGPGGEPIGGAHVAPIPRDPGTFSDAEGRGELRLDLAVRALRVVAETFETAEVQLPPPEQPLELTLRRATALALQVATSIEGAGVRIRSPEPPFLRQGEPSWWPEPCGYRSESGARIPEDSVAFFGAADGIYLLNNVRPGIPLSVELVDAGGERLAEQLVTALLPGEMRVVRLAGEAPARTLAGRLLTPEGMPVAGAKVEVGPGSGVACWHGETDSEGGFRVAGLTSERVRLVVTASTPFYAPLVRDPQPVIESPPVQLVLDEGRTLRILVRGPSGLFAQEASAGIRLSGSSWSAHVKTEQGEALRLERAPLAALSVEVWTGARRFEHTLAAGAGQAELDVQIPAWQGFHLRWSAPRALHADERLLVRLWPPDGLPLARRTAPSGPRGEELFPVVFPGRYELTVAVVRENDEVLACEPRWVEVPPDAPAHETVELLPR
jgi:hypothetical protein